MNKLPLNLNPAGYLLLQNPEVARRSNTYRENFGVYSGVDRIPPILPPPKTASEYLGTAPFRADELHAAREQWLDSRFGNTAFIPSRDIASRLLMAFRSFGYQLELVFCDLAWTKGEESRLGSYPVFDDGLPADSLTLGFDISWPTCNHSAILQPGIVPGNPAWRSRLNTFGLLDDYGDATTLRDEYLIVYPYPPMDIYLVKRVTGGS
jgi:hypothetical protein